jgi:hypothetical protein
MADGTQLCQKFLQHDCRNSFCESGCWIQLSQTSSFIRLLFYVPETSTLLIRAAHGGSSKSSFLDQKCTLSMNLAS